MPMKKKKKKKEEEKKKLVVVFRNFANAPKSSALWTTRVGVLRLTGLVVLAADLRECVPGRTVPLTAGGSHSVPSKARLYSLQNVHTHHYRDSTHILVSTWPLDAC